MYDIKILAMYPQKFEIFPKNALHYSKSMTHEAPDGDLFFETLTPLGFRVRVTHAYWKLIVTIKHPIMDGREIDVQETLAHPEEIRQSRYDPNVYLFYKTERIGR